MRFLIDRCAGVRLARWLREQGHDVVESRERGTDPGDRALLELAAAEDRILVTIDTDFGQLVFTQDLPRCGLIRLPDVPAEQRIALVADVIARHASELAKRAIITVRAGRVRIAYPPARD